MLANYSRAAGGNAPSRCATLLLLALLVLIGGLSAGAQTPDGTAAAVETTGDATPAAAAEPEPQDLDGSTPRSGMLAYLLACREGDYARAAGFMDLSRIPAAQRETRGPDLARKLKVVLDQKLWVDLDALSNEPEGDLEDGLTEGTDRVGVIHRERGDAEVLMTRKWDGGTAVWMISAGTVGRIESLYADYGYGRVGEWLPDFFFDVRFLEVQLWQWVALLLLIGAALLFAHIAGMILHRIAMRFTAKTESTLDDRIAALVLPPLRLVFAIAAFSISKHTLGLSVPAVQAINLIEKALIVVAVTWLALRAVDLGASLAVDHFTTKGPKRMLSVVPLGRRTGKVILLIFAVVAMLQSFGFNVTGLIAGLGVGGIAVALAAQKTIENLFGGVSLIADQPINVGDFCRFGDKIGTVEEIGLRSTRVRTLDRTLISVPNNEFSSAQIENFAARDKIRLFTTLGLRYETTPDQLRHVLAGLRRLLHSHPRVDLDPLRVRFVGFGAYSLDIEVFAYVTTTDFNEFVTIREDIFLRMMDVVDASGTGFAFPSQTTYLARDGGLDAEKARAAADEVQVWRSEGKLPFPQFSEEEIRAMDDTLDYPPRGSAVSAGADDPGL